VQNLFALVKIQWFSVKVNCHIFTDYNKWLTTAISPATQLQTDNMTTEVTKPASQPHTWWTTSTQTQFNGRQVQWWSYGSQSDDSATVSDTMPLMIPTTIYQHIQQHSTHRYYTLYIHDNIAAQYRKCSFGENSTFFMQALPIILRDLHWLPVWQRITIKIALLVYKYQHSMAPQHLQVYCDPASTLTTRHLRSARLTVPRTRTN